MQTYMCHILYIPYSHTIQIGHNSNPLPLSPSSLFPPSTPTGARRSVENEIVNEEVEVHPLTSQPQDISRWVPGVNDGDPNAIVLYVSNYMTSYFCICVLKN